MSSLQVDTAINGVAIRDHSVSLFHFFTAWQRDGDHSRCFYCGVTMLSHHVPEVHPHFKTKDHFIPKSRKKLWLLLPVPLHNVCLKVNACRACNAIKSNRTAESLRSHVRKMTGSDTFFAEAITGMTLRSLPDYIAYCRAVREAMKKEAIELTKKSLKAVAERRAAGLLPPVGHKASRRQAMKENVWWNAMNAVGKLIWALERNGDHLDVAAKLRDTIADIKGTLPEEFARLRLGDTFNAEILEKVEKV